MGYKNVICVAYTIQTVDIKAEDGTLKTKEYKGAKTDKDDIESRCLMMTHAISEAYKKVGMSVGSLVLFMAPEFYFRPKSGAYSIENISTIMEKIRAETGKDKYDDWLFVLGTAVGYLDQGKETEVFNIALIQKGGHKKADGVHDRIVYKELISGVDFKIKNPDAFMAGTDRRAKIGGNRKVILPTTGSKDIGSLGKNPLENEEQSDKMGFGGGSVFTMDGVRFGLEICADHAGARLGTWLDEVKSASAVHVHLITGAGIGIIPGNVICDEEGLVFLVNGTSGTDAELCQRSFGKLVDIAQEGKDTEVAVDTDNLLAVRRKKYFYTRGSLRVFEKTALPS